MPLRCASLTGQLVAAESDALVRLPSLVLVSGAGLCISLPLAGSGTKLRPRFSQSVACNEDKRAARKNSAPTTGSVAFAVVVVDVVVQRKNNDLLLPPVRLFLAPQVPPLACQNNPAI